MIPPLGRRDEWEYVEMIHSLNTNLSPFFKYAAAHECAAAVGFPGQPFIKADNVAGETEPSAGVRSPPLFSL